MRIVCTTAVWVGMGVVLGLLAGTGTGFIGFAAAVSAGVILLGPLGLVLALTGAKWNECLTGATVGMVLGVAVSLLLGRPEPNRGGAVGLICGGLFGATAINLFYRLPRYVAAKYRSAA